MIFYWAGVVGCVAVGCSLAVILACGWFAWLDRRARRAAEARMIEVLHRDRARGRA